MKNTERTSLMIRNVLCSVGVGEFLGYIASASSATTAEKLYSIYVFVPARSDTSPSGHANDRKTIHSGAVSVVGVAPTLANATVGDDTELSLTVVLPLQNGGIGTPAANPSAQPNKNTKNFPTSVGACLQAGMISKARELCP